MSRIAVMAVAAASFGLAMGQIASAADMAVKAPVYRPAPPPAPPPLTWTGCYIGGNLGAGWQGTDQTYIYGSYVEDAGSDTKAGFVGGGQIGCDYQTGPWVFGIQGMFDGASIKGSHSYPGDPAGTLGAKAEWFGTATGRIGYAFQPQTLIYVKGGAAWEHKAYTDDYNGYSCECESYHGEASKTLSGWTVGGGFEYAFLPNWSAFVEYNYMDFGSRDTTLKYSDGGTDTFSYKHKLQTVLVGVNFRFGH
jgi:outer membrane immunogenic protein